MSSFDDFDDVFLKGGGGPFGGGRRRTLEEKKKGKVSLSLSLLNPKFNTWSNLM